jgi:hypothetical protein
VREAEKDLRAAIAANPTQAGALNVLSAIQYVKFDEVESHNLAQRAYEADAYLTAAPDILWRLYATSYDLEQFVNAQKWCDEANDRFPRTVVATRCRLWIMTAKGQSRDPAEAWRRAADYEAVAPRPRMSSAERDWLTALGGCLCARAPIARLIREASSLDSKPSSARNLATKRKQSIYCNDT